ncbi:cupin domain-containing protein [Nocardia huaxiensis]|uniref:Cupin domain-containing protein n=1 Tax=Nocardia huaxiensis TaxID=2755382 RepID=A0A7D6VEN5_9NOCA|nr:cupin domain-containing protein [Nocardia huaxiensis]QLY33674.1 cupin domain-containing protein [Nocardia huaxiensis]UFS99410.1 cupin domain-containing protein [Nocardia huaxiensis]
MHRRTLTFHSGHRVTFVEEGVDEAGPYLRLEHVLPRAQRQAGPHWHPVLAERWTVRKGRLRFRIDGVETVVHAGDSAEAAAGTVHGFWSEKPGTIIDHTVRPPLRHWQMFELWHALDAAGKTTSAGVPRDPLALALLWDYQDGYLGGLPAGAQRVVLGGLARLARRLGYERRWLPEHSGRTPAGARNR